MANRWGNSQKQVADYIFFGLQNHSRWWLQLWNKKMLTPWKKSYDQPRQHIEKQRHYFANKGPYNQSYGFSSSHIWMWELDYKGGWVPKNWCFWTVVLEKTLERALDRKKIQPVHPKGDQSWVFIGRTVAEVEAPILWPPMKSQLTGKDLDAGKNWGQEEKRTASLTQWTRIWVNSKRWWRKGSLMCRSPWGSQRVRHNLTTERQHLPIVTF